MPALAFFQRDPVPVFELIDSGVPINEFYGWVEVVVTEYDRRSKLYMCTRVDGISDVFSVPRIYVMFKAEDPVNFGRRIADAIYRRQDVENRIK